MTEQWSEVIGEQGKIVRWNEVPKDDTQKEKTVYVGPVVQGVLEDVREHIGENDAKMYVIRTEEHGLLSVWGTTVLNDKLESLTVGTEVKIELTGTQKPKAGGKAYFVFKVFSRQAPMTEVKPEETEDKLPEM